MNNCPVKMALWNARGIRYKKDEFFHFINTNNIDVCCVTWLNENISIKLNNYYCYRYDRQQVRGGGVVILIKKNIKYELLPLKIQKLLNI